MLFKHQLPGGAALKRFFAAKARAAIADFFGKWRSGSASVDMLDLVARQAIMMLASGDGGSSKEVRIVTSGEFNANPGAFCDPPFVIESPVIKGWTYTPPPGLPLEEQMKAKAAIEYVRKHNGEREP